ncbi:formate dehydrogenase subunit gamma [Rhodoferax sp.]|uniref:formate dehydrogenase subunit gamma n=1 Tax=Rhodoferax sp. TaxID=50421 RepID=UPI00272191DB|nr:formate dehydrogenase subunit gamma [Rhodoferax sp.]MDO9145208.1 formate dehydrogenase subunit gamma [Rhodoferax sp.]MDP3864903.1 formate dehydrogenase subunit gamma [Rhodoferax sp.]
MIKAFSVLAALALCWSSAVAQTTPATAPAPDAAPAAVMPGIQGQNILDVKPDASEEPGYANQTNGERVRVQPGNNAPMWRQVNSGVAGYSSLPKSEAPEAGVLIQPFVQYPGSRLTNAGEAWRQVRNNWLIPYGGSLLLIVLGAIALFHFKIGPIKVKEELTGRVIERFSAFERSAHWANVAAFLVLAVSGVVMAFGKFFLLPIMGTTLFGWLSYVLKNAHNFAGPLFAVSLLVVIVTFMRDNLPAKGDLAWLLKGGGIFSGHEIDSGRYNAGEKVVFWGGVFFLGITVVVSGLAMDKLLPGLSYDRSTMQIAHMIHSVSNLLMLVMMMGHIYLGTLGTKGAYQGMRTGYVDETWAEQHHKLWFDDIKAGRIPAQRTPSATPAAQSGKVVQV